MKQWWAALLVVLALCAFNPRYTAAQSTQQGGRDQGAGAVLGQNYPNPFNPETTIPFSIGGAPGCPDPSRQFRVSLRIYNVLAQLVAVPVLQGGSAGVAGGQPLSNVLLTCGQYTAYCASNSWPILTVFCRRCAAYSRTCGDSAAGLAAARGERMPRSAS